MTGMRRYQDDDPRVIACQKAIRWAGGMSRMAEALNVTFQAIYAWQIVPEDRCLQVYEITGIPVYELRPDIFGDDKPARRTG
jgi:hypothetical protein